MGAAGRSVGTEGSQPGFVECYPWNEGMDQGGNLSYTDFSFGVSSSETGGTDDGTLG